MAIRQLSFFEKYLTLWVALSILGGTALGALFPAAGNYLGKFTIVQVSIPIAICLFFMMFPVMVKIDFSQIKEVAKTPKPVILTLVINWLIKPFSMYAIAYFFIGYLFADLIPGTEVINGVEVELYRSYISGTILLGIAPCTAMVLMWGHLARGNDAFTLVMVAVNSLTMLFLYVPLGGLLLSVNQMPIPWQTIALSVLIYVGLPLLLGYFTRKRLIKSKGLEYFNRTFLPRLSPIAIGALLTTLVLLFVLKGQVLLTQPFDILLIAIPLTIQTLVIFGVGYLAARLLKLSYESAAPAAMTGASNHFEVAIATAVVLFGLNSGAAVATVVGVMIEVPLMLMLVKFCLATKNWFNPYIRNKIAMKTEAGGQISKGTCS